MNAKEFIREVYLSASASVDLATATDTELATAAEIASNNMAVFGINASQSSSMTINQKEARQLFTQLVERFKPSC